MLLDRPHEIGAQGGLVGGAAEENVQHVLVAFQPCARGFEGPQFVRDVTDDVQVHPPRRGHDRPENVGRENGYHLDEIRAGRVQRIDHVRRLSGARQRYAQGRQVGGIAIEDCPRGNHAWFRESMLRQADACTRDAVELAEHLPHARDAMGNEQRAERRERLRPGRMHMHVPQPRDEGIAGRIQNQRALRYPHGVARPERLDAVSPYHDCHVLTRACARHVDHRDMRERERSLVLVSASAA